MTVPPIRQASNVVSAYARQDTAIAQLRPIRLLQGNKRDRMWQGVYAFLIISYYLCRPTTVIFIKLGMQQVDIVTGRSISSTTFTILMGIDLHQ
jgi:hypothetical protein